jgi:hypothetical protein
VTASFLALSGHPGVSNMTSPNRWAVRPCTAFSKLSSLVLVPSSEEPPGIERCNWDQCYLCLSFLARKYLRDAYFKCVLHSESRASQLLVPLTTGKNYLPLKGRGTLHSGKQLFRTPLSQVVHQFLEAPLAVIHAIAALKNHPPTKPHIVFLVPQVAGLHEKCNVLAHVVRQALHHLQKAEPTTGACHLCMHLCKTNVHCLLSLHVVDNAPKEPVCGCNTPLK